MFHWICPECGREIPPRLKECPSCDPQSAPMVNVPEAVINNVPEAVTGEPASVVNVAADEAAAPVTSTPAPGPAPNLALIPAPIRAPSLEEIATPVESPVAAAATEAERAAVPATVHAAIHAAKTTEPADPLDHAATDPAAVDQAVIEEPAAAQPELVAAGHLELSTVEPATAQPDLLLALAEQIRDAQTRPASSTDGPHLIERGEPAHVSETEHAHASTDVAPDPVASADVAPDDIAPEPPPTPAEPQPAANAVTGTATSAPISQIKPQIKPQVNPRVNPEDAVTLEIFLPPVLARLAASIGVSEPQSTAPESGSPGSVSPEHVTPTWPASASKPGASVSRTTGPLELTIESVGRIESIGLIESNPQVESARTQVEPEYAHVGRFALQPDAGALALLAPPEAAPAPVENAAIEAPPEPVPPLPPTITALASPEEPAAQKAPSGSWLQLAPLQDYSAATARAMQPVPFATKILTPDSGPRMTLPGPTLPPELARFQNANLVTVIGSASRTGKFRLPGWTVSFLVMLVLLVIGVGVVFYFLPVAHSNAETQAPVEGHAIASQPATPAPVPSQPASHPLAQYIEVTGFRIVVDFNKKSEIHYLIVNHSGADLSDVTVYVTLRTASAKPGQPPVCRFSFRAPSLGPFESKEMTSSIEKLTRSITLPDWQDLRPEVQIAQ